MGKNIIFVILFVLVCIASYIAGSYRPDAIPTDAMRNGEFTQVGDDYLYESKTFGFSLAFDKDWVIYDGAKLQNTIRNAYNDAEIENRYGCNVNELNFIGGFVAPNASLEITIVKDTAIPEKEFSAPSMENLLNELRESVSGMNGKWSDGKAHYDPLNGDGRILMYHYEYDFIGKRYSVFYASANVNGNVISMNGKYDNEDGLNTLHDFAKNLNILESSAA